MLAAVSNDDWLQCFSLYNCRKNGLEMTSPSNAEV